MSRLGGEQEDAELGAHEAGEDLHQRSTVEFLRDRQSRHLLNPDAGDGGGAKRLRVVGREATGDADVGHLPVADEPPLLVRGQCA